MKQLLSLQASLFGEDGSSHQLSEQFITRLQQRHPQLAVTRRDLSAEPLPHLSAEAFAGFQLPVSERTGRQLAAGERSERLIEELQQSDVIVLGLPMYNFGTPSTLKAWIDHVARAGITFRYTDSGPEGLLTGKKLYVIATRGGQYAGTPVDTQSDYIRNFFGFIGIRDLEFIYAEGLARTEGREQSLSQAKTLLHQKAAA